MIMKPHMCLNTQTQYYNNQSHVGSIMPLKSKLYNDEKNRKGGNAMCTMLQCSLFIIYSNAA